MTRIDGYRQILKTLDDWVPFLKRESGLPGPRGNLELAHAVAQEGNKELFDQITAAMERARDRKDDSFKVLRQGMAYCWSVAVAACPEAGKPLIEKWLSSHDSDIRWMLNENLKKTRLVKMDPGWVRICSQRLKSAS